jgi:hypothetical protein
MAEVYAKLYSTLEDRADIEIESRAVERATAWLSDLEHRYGIDPGAVNAVVGTPAVENRQMAKGSALISSF